jgi:hypothetical protein
MKAKEFITEKLLHSEFTIGFELEAFYALTGSERVLGGEETLDLIKGNIVKELSNYIPTQGSKFSDEYSLKPPKNSKHFFPFEWNSPVMNFNIETAKTLLNLFSNIDKLKIRTNQSCGLHFHIAFPHITDDDMIWLTTKLAIDQEMRHKITKFEGFNFLSKQYAKDDYLNEINHCLKHKMWGMLTNMLSEEKYRILRMHPQGTLEWRGPRNFLNKPDQQITKEFIILLWKFVSWLSKTLDENEIDGITKKEFFQNIKQTNKLLPIITNKDLIEKIRDNPKLLQKITNRKAIVSILTELGMSIYHKAGNLTPETQVVLVDINPRIAEYIQNPSMEMYKKLEEILEQNMKILQDKIYNDAVGDKIVGVINAYIMKGKLDEAIPMIIEKIFLYGENAAKTVNSYINMLGSRNAWAKKYFRQLLKQECPEIYKNFKRDGRLS